MMRDAGNAAKAENEVSSWKRRVCLFGLSADPPTGEGGHVGIVRTLSSLSRFDEIRVLPVYKHTYASKRTRLAKFEDRMAMCRIAFGEIPKVLVAKDEYHSWCRKVKDVQDEEEKAKVSVGTAALLEYLHETEKETEFTFCLGADAFMDLTAGKWKESERVLSLLRGRLLVLNRVEDDETPGDSHSVDAELRERVQSIGGAKLISIPSVGAVSSSRVREALNSHSSAVLKDETMIHPGVLEYIRQHGLYSRQGDMTRSV